MNEEFLESLLSETLMKGNRNNFINRLRESKLLGPTLANMEPFADKRIGELLAKIVKSDYSMKNVGDLEDYIKTISKDKTFSEVFNMSSKLEGDAVLNSMDQVNQFLTPMNEMEQRISDIVKNAIKEEIAYKQQNAVSQFSDDECDEVCPECGQMPCACNGDSLPQDGRGCAAGLGADPAAIMNDKPSTEINDRVDDLEEAFSHISNILCKMKSRTKNFDDGEDQSNMEQSVDQVPQQPEEDNGDEDDKSKAYYDGLNTAKKLEDMPEDPEEAASELAENYGYKPGTDDQADFVEGFMAGLSQDDSDDDDDYENDSDELQYSAEHDVFYTNDDVFYYSDKYGVYANEDGEVLYYSEAKNEYMTKPGDVYFSELEEFSQNTNNEVEDMKNVTVYFSDEDQCFFSEFGEKLEWNPDHKAYIGENGSVYFSETGPQVPKSVDFSCGDKVALFSEKGTKIISYSEVDEDGDLICYSDDGMVLVYDKINKCYFSANGEVYFDSEDLEEMEEANKTEVAPVAPAGEPLNPYDLGLLPTGEQMAAEDNALVEPKDNIKEEVDSTMANRVATNADGIPSEFAPAAPVAPTPATPVAPAEENKEFSCISFSEVEGDAVARYNKLQEYFSAN